MLSDVDIDKLLSTSAKDVEVGFDEHSQAGNWIDADSTLLIYPFEPKLLTPVGYDLTIGDYFYSHAEGNVIKISKNKPAVIQPRETVLIITSEYVGMPKNRAIAGLITSKVSKVSLGLSHICTTIDHDWEGHLLIAVTNHAEHRIVLNKDEPFCTAVFTKSESPAGKASDKVKDRKDIEVALLHDVYTTEKAKEVLEKQKTKSEEAKSSKLANSLPNLTHLVVVLFFAIYAYSKYGLGTEFAAITALGAVIGLALKDLVKGLIHEGAVQED